MCNARDPVHLDGLTRVHNRRSEPVPTRGDTAGRGRRILDREERRNTSSLLSRRPFKSVAEQPSQPGFSHSTL
jgi:hypothetical protein